MNSQKDLHLPRFPLVKPNIPLADNRYVHQEIFDNDIRLQISLEELLAEKTSTIGALLRVFLQAKPNHLQGWEKRQNALIWASV